MKSEISETLERQEGRGLANVFTDVVKPADEIKNNLVEIILKKYSQHFQVFPDDLRKKNISELKNIIDGYEKNIRQLKKVSRAENSPQPLAVVGFD